MSASNVPVTPGTGKNVATYQFTDQDASVKDLGRVTLNDFQGTVIGSSTNPMIVNQLGSMAMYFDRANPNVIANAGTGTFQVFLPDTGHTLGYIQGSQTSIAVYFDRANPNVTANAGTGTFQVFLPDTGHTLGYIQGSQSSIAVYFDRGNPAVNVSQFGGNNVVTPNAGIPLINVAHTAAIASGGGSVSGSYAGNSVSGGTIISPSSSYNFKIYAINLTTTAQSSITAKFTNGAGTSPTELWRYALQASTQGISGANLAVTPPAYLFSTGTNTTLSLVLDSGSLVHYSVAYFKESA